MKLTAERVDEVMLGVMFDEEKLPDDGELAALPLSAIVVRNVAEYGFVFDGDLVKQNRHVIEEMLAEVSPVDANKDRSDRVWGTRQHVQALFAMGIAAGLVSPADEGLFQQREPACETAT